MLTKSQLKAAINLKLSDYPDFCICDGSIVRTKMLSSIWNICGKSRVNILDIGCGTAQMWKPFLENMPNVHLYGFDPSKESITTAKINLRGLKANICQGSITAIDNIFSEISNFDFIVSHSVLEHVFPRHLYFEIIRTRLNKNGVALISWGSDHFRQGLRTDLRNYLSRLLANLGVENFYTHKVNEEWAKIEILNANLEISLFHHYSIVELKKILKFVPQKSKIKIFQNWIEIEEELNKCNEEKFEFKHKMDETFLVLTKSNKNN